MSDVTNYKCYENTRYEILTDVGFKPFRGIIVGENRSKCKLQFSDNTSITCTFKHKLATAAETYTYAEDLNLGDIIYGNKKLVDVSIYDNADPVYEIFHVEDVHRYLSFNDLENIKSSRVLNHQCLALDELGFVPAEIAKDFFTSVYPVISRGKDTKLFIFSTPNGVGNLFHELWEKAKSNESKDGWKPFRIHWWDVPGRDDAWKATMINEIGAERFAQEFACDFLSSTTPSLVDGDSVEKFRRYISASDRKHSPISVAINDKTYELKQWYLPSLGRTYLMSGDVGDGVGLDSSVLHVWDITEFANIRLVASFSSNKISTAEFAVFIDAVGRLYNFPYFVLESNGLGRAVLDLLSSVYQYPHIIRYSSNKRNSTLGIFSHIQIKVRACKFIKDMLSTGIMQFDIPDEDLIEEMPYFVRKATSYHAVYEAIRGKHDDQIMSWIWAIFCLSDEILPSYFNVTEYDKNVIGKNVPKYIKSTVNTDELDLELDYSTLRPADSYIVRRTLLLQPGVAAKIPLSEGTVTSEDIMDPAVKSIAIDSKYVRSRATVPVPAPEEFPETAEEQLLVSGKRRINNIRQMIEDISEPNEDRIYHGFNDGFRLDSDPLDFSAGENEELFK